MIEDYALIGDMRSAALISRDGSVDWLCVPRFDSPACFAALLGDDRHGHWSIAPAAVAEAVDNVGDPPGPKTSPAPQPRRPGAPQTLGEGIEVTRRYLGDTLILETDWHTPTGDIRVTDFMPPRDVRRRPGAHRGRPVRVGGRVLRVPDPLRVRPGDAVGAQVDSCLLAVAGPDSLWLDTPVTLTGRSFAHEATFTVMAASGFRSC
jgi:hypothetical protein